MTRYIEDDIFISINEAMNIAKELGIPITRPTAIRWIKKFDLGYQPGKSSYSHWVVNKIKWKDFILDRD